MTDNPKDAERLAVAIAICKSRTCEGMYCCQWPANAGRLDCPVKRGGYDEAARDAIAAMPQLASRDTKIADLERRLAKTRAEVVRLQASRSFINDALPAAPPPPVAEASGKRECTCGDHCSINQGYPAGEGRYCRLRTPQPTTDHTAHPLLQAADKALWQSIDVAHSGELADHTERARALAASLWMMGRIAKEDDEPLLTTIDNALTAAERAGAKKIIQWLEARAINIRDNGPKSSEGLLTAMAGAHVGALLDAATALRALSQTNAHAAAERAEKMRALDEAVIEAARAIHRQAEHTESFTHAVIVSKRLWQGLGKVLNDKDALAARDAALTEDQR